MTLPAPQPHRAPLRYLSLFSGIGGMDLGLDRAGMQCIAQVEIDPYCRRVLAKHWPDVPKFEDVRTFNLPKADYVVGGFPCTDISTAGKRAGLSGEYSGIWREMLRCIRVVRRGIVENVAALLFRGMGEVLGDLAAIGNDAEWDCLPACDFGADIVRDRIFIHTFPESQGRESVLCGEPRIGITPHESWGIAPTSLDSPDDRAQRIESWLCEPAILGSIDGTSKGLEQRLGGCGNAVLPQISEWIGRRILSVEVYP